MNTKMLMLGILLIAGLSFAQNWMEYSVNRYGCNYIYNSKGWNEIGLNSIAVDYDETVECEGDWNLRAMDGYREDMSWALWDDGEDEMCYHSGCWYSGEGTSVTEFRSSMIEYNVAAAGFKAEFLSGLRTCLADGGSRADILEDLQDARADYLDCLADSTASCYQCRVG
jgi:hypothetical protein